MKLQHPFIQLPLQFDARALAAEIATIDATQWKSATGAGVSELALINPHGDASFAGNAGPMRSTQSLRNLEVVQQVLAHLGAVLGRARLTRWSGQTTVNTHDADAYYEVDRMRIVVPIVTAADVHVDSGDSQITLAAGTCWIVDTWRMRSEQNAGSDACIHLIVDSVGGPGLWDLIARGRPHGVSMQGWKTEPVMPVAHADFGHQLVFESVNAPSVMTPWELRAHLAFLFAETLPHANLALLSQAAGALVSRWHALWTAGGASEQIRPRYRDVLEAFINQMRMLAPPIRMRNGRALISALQSIVVDAALGAASSIVKLDEQTATIVSADHLALRESVASLHFERPVFIVSPPRSGSTLLFETLSQAPDVFTIGDESHELIEGIAALHPTAFGFESNQLDATHATDAVATRLRGRFANALVDREGKLPSCNHVRLVEKTPKNSLRVAFLQRVFPHAQFIYLYRAPQEVLASMFEGWQSQRFTSYPVLPGWSGRSWSFLLVPGWRDLVGKPLIEIVAAQWNVTTQILLRALGALPAENVHVLRYADLLTAPDAAIKNLCASLGLRWDRVLESQLPIARHTLSKPDSEKWRVHSAAIQSVWPAIEQTVAEAECFVSAHQTAMQPSITTVREGRQQSRVAQ